MEANRNDSYQEMTDKVLKHSIVRLRSAFTIENLDSGSVMMGSGFFVDSNLILTNLHGIAGAISTTAEIVSTNTEYTIEGVVAHDITNDLVLLRVASEGVPIPIGNSDTAIIGDVLSIVGHPNGEKGVAQQVKIHGIQKTDKKFLFTETFHPGQSGSPLLNDSGEVVGVAVHVTMEIPIFSGQSKSGLSHAIPANRITSLLSCVGDVTPLDEWQNLPHIRSYHKALQGQFHLLHRNLESAIDCFNISLKLNPDLVVAYCNRAAINIVSGDTKKAIADCSRAIKLNPDYVEAYINRATAYMSLNRYAKVVADCDTALKLNPDNVQAYLYKAMVNFALEKHSEALEYYDKVLSLNHTSLEAYFWRGNTKALLNDLEGAIEDFNKVIFLNEKIGRYMGVYRCRGDAKYELGEYADAIQDYDKAIDEKPDDDEVYNRRGLAKKDHAKSREITGEKEIDEKLYADAIEDFTQAIRNKSDFAGYWNNRAIAKRNSKDYEGAIEDCDQALRLNPKYNFAYYNRAFAKCLLGETKSEADSIDFYIASIDDYTKAIELNPKDISAYNNRGHVNYLLGKVRADNGDILTCIKNYQESIKDYTDTFRLDPKNSSALNNRAWNKYLLGKIETNQGNVEKALKQFQNALNDCNVAIKMEIENPSSVTYHTRAAVYVAIKNYEKAIEDFDMTIGLDPDDAIALFERGLAKQEIGEHEQAEEDFAAAKKLDPEVESKLS